MEGADRAGGQLRGDKDQCPFSDVTKSGRVWRKVPESDARSVGRQVSVYIYVLRAAQGQLKLYSSLSIYIILAVLVPLLAASCSEDRGGGG